MSKIASFFGGIRSFCGETVAELKKCAWPNHQELWDSTVVVILSVVLLGGFIAVCDIVLRWAVRFVFRA